MTPRPFPSLCQAFSWRWRLACAVLAAFTLGGCGPGVGGSGSGSSGDPGGGGGASISFTAGDVCEADFADTALSCAGVSPLPGAGTLPIAWADTDKPGETTVAATLEGHDMTLDQPCAQVHFNGTWGRLADGQQAFVGTLTDPEHPDGVSALATVSPERANPDAVGWVALLDAEGTLLHPAWLLYKTEAPITYAACASPPGTQSQE